MNRIAYVGIIVFVAAAFTVAALTGGQGPIFLASLVAAAAVLIVIVFYMAFAGDRTAPRSQPESFLAFEEATRYLGGGGFVDEGGAEPRGLGGSRTGDETSKVSVRAFVSTLVPKPIPPPDFPADRQAFLDALRKEGTGLIRLAKVTGVDVAPYQAFLEDARKGALAGDWRATLRSLQLANELLRATIEKFLIKRKRAGEEDRDLETW